MTSRSWIIGVACLVVAALALCLSLFVLALTNKWPAPLMYESVAVVAVGIITFFGFLYGLKGPDQRLDDSAMRTAITAGLVSAYLVLVGLVSFIHGDDSMPAITETMLGSFTALIALVVPFYFGSTAYVQAQKIKQGEPDAAKPTAPATLTVSPAPTA